MPSEYKLIQFKKFKGGLHLARGLTNSYDKSLKQLHSDTLKSAIFANALQLYPELGEAGADNKFLKGKIFLESFSLSSAFPFYESPSPKKTYYFFPKPHLVKLPFEDDGSNPRLAKDLKKVRYIEKGLFEKLLNRNDTANFKFEQDSLKSAFIGDNDLKFKKVLEADQCDKIISTDTYQHVAISRDYGTDSMPYYVDKIYFHHNAGLFFLVEVADDEVWKKVKAALRLIADSGMGTDRNGGNGHFELDTKQSITFDLPQKANFQLSLSLYCPKEEEVTDIMDSYFEITKRGGYISSPAQDKHRSLRKRSIYMFTEGSLFPKMKTGKRTGKIVNLSPDCNLPQALKIGHPIWRDGRAIFLPMRLP